MNSYLQICKFFCRVCHPWLEAQKKRIPLGIPTLKKHSEKNWILELKLNQWYGDFLPGLVLDEFVITTFLGGPTNYTSLNLKKIAMLVFSKYTNQVIGIAFEIAYTSWARALGPKPEGPKLSLYTLL